MRIAKIQIPKISSIAKNSSFVAKAQIDDTHGDTKAPDGTSNDLPDETSTPNSAIVKNTKKPKDKRKKTKVKPDHSKDRSMETIG